MKGSDHTVGYGSGTAAIVGRPAVRGANTKIYITNCVVDSVYLVDKWYDTSSSNYTGIHIGGLIGYLKADAGTTPSFTLYLFNNPVYVTGMWVPGTTTSFAAGSLVGYINGVSDSKNDMRVFFNATDFNYDMVYKAAYPTKTKAYTTDPGSGKRIGLMIGYLNKSMYPNTTSQYNYEYLCVPKAADEAGAWLVYDGGDLNYTNVKSRWAYSSTYTDVETLIDNSHMNNVSKWNERYTNEFTGMKWNYKSAGNGTPTDTSKDERPYITWGQTDTLW